MNQSKVSCFTHRWFPFNYNVLYISLLQLVSMLDIKEIYQEFQKLNKTDNCIVIVLKNETKLAITSPVSLALVLLGGGMCDWGMCVGVGG